MRRIFAAMLAAGSLGLAVAQAVADASPGPAHDEAPVEAPAPPPALRQALDRIIPGQAPESIRPAPVPGFFEVSYGAEIFYITGDGRYVLQGDLLDLASRVNLTETRRAAFRAALMKTVTADETITFAPRGATRYPVYVFTDVDCTYCRKLHSQIAEYNERGIEIRYLAYPRTGINTPSYFKAVSVWCAADRKAAITAAKAGQPVPRRSCDNPVRRHMELAAQVGVSGTPTLVFADGSVLPGYASPDQLKEYLDARFGR